MGRPGKENKGFLNQACLACLLIVVLPVFLGGGCGKSLSPEKAAGPEFPQDQYLVAQGTGKTGDAARRQALAELSRIFESRISSRFTSITSSTDTGEAPEVFEQKSESGISIASEVRLQGARIGKVWKDRDRDSFHALAVLDRDQAGRAWASRLGTLDTGILAQTFALEGVEGRLSRLAALNRIMTLTAQREELAARLGVIDYPVDDFSGADLGALAREQAVIKSNLRVYVYISGEYGGRAGEIIARELSRKGIVLVGDSKIANAGVLGRIEVSLVDLKNPNVNFVRARGSIRIFEDQPQTIFAQINENTRKGHQDTQEARFRAVESVSASLSKGLMDALGFDEN